ADLLLTRNDNGDTPLHAAAYEGHLDQVPLGLLTEENLNVRNYEGVSVGRTAINCGYSEHIPAPFRPKERGPIGRFLERIGATRPPF
ncbi:MAG TPA: ankyrin repeat domain-containing protein, partial [Opitutus sp.]|nr:ankyrin repeat domain-containing protein [Opitutus sp.]